MVLQTLPALCLALLKDRRIASMDHEHAGRDRCWQCGFGGNIVDLDMLKVYVTQAAPSIITEFRLTVISQGARSRITRRFKNLWRKHNFLIGSTACESPISARTLVAYCVEYSASTTWPDSRNCRAISRAAAVCQLYSVRSGT